MKTLIILGSPRKKGNSELLIEQVVAGIEEAGSTAELVRLHGMDISPCLGCGGCEKEGNCVVQDDMQGLYEKIDRADRIIIAPVHDVMVSRTQLYIDIAAKSEFLVENRSKKSSLFLESGRKLPPGESCYLSVPVGISLAKIAVRLAEP